MKNKDEILNQVRIKYNKSLTEEETLNILKRNHNEPIISPDECYLAMECYAKISENNRFNLALTNMVGRLTYNELTA